jgi:hypothetical protein
MSSIGNALNIDLPKQIKYLQIGLYECPHTEKLLQQQQSDCDKQIHTKTQISCN